jgi:Mg-chelatase subunit ChlD
MPKPGPILSPHCAPPFPGSAAQSGFFPARGWLCTVAASILPSDFRYIRFRHRTESTAIFAVDASGSTAMERLAEAKGAIELLLGDCYVRRDQVALISFRGLSAETLLEPTRSLVRAKRSLTGLPGGGPTPLAGAIRRSLEIAGMVQRRGQSPLIVYLTDGSGNIALDGKADRVRAGEDAQMLARHGAALGYRSILIDISRRPREATRDLARSMQAQYCPLAHRFGQRRQRHRQRRAVKRPRVHDPLRRLSNPRGCGPELAVS